MSEVGGISLGELNTLELALVHGLRFSCMVSKQELVNVLTSLPQHAASPDNAARALLEAVLAPPGFYAAIAAPPSTTSLAAP